MQYTKSGQPFLENPRGRVRALRGWATCTLGEIEREYGAGTRLYFSFLKWMGIVNVFASVCGCISWILFLSDPTKPSGFSWGDFFVSAYMRPQSDAYWFWPNQIIFISWWLVGPIYFLWERFVFEPIQKPRALPKNDTISANVGKKPDYFFSSSATLFAVCVAAGLFYGLVWAQIYVVNTYGSVIYNIDASTVMCIPLSLAFVVCNTIWDRLAFRLTQTENNRTWFYFRASQATKLIVFKVVTGTVLFALLGVMTETDSNACNIQNGGINFFLSICVDIFLITAVVQTFLPLIIRAFRIHVCRKEPAPWPEFDISQGLLLLMYRQFLLYIAILVVPPIGVLGVVAIVVQYPLDKAKLLHFSSGAHYIQDQPGYFILLFTGIIAMAAVFTYPNGALWILYVPGALPTGFQNCSIIGAVSRL